MPITSEYKKAGKSLPLLFVFFLVKNARTNRAFDAFQFG